ncbi:formate dehydrogenase subunit gamma [Actimicrobium antarcticum]|uniref:Formate dehydrogenase subunit gamma n=1 Tax=Actimicrobium antarcticum TaxID=1051899 RepID=A0ABP7SZF7_9BURK
MNHWIARFAVGLSLTAAIAGPALAQSTDPAAASAAPAVESVDILKQNQAERTRDQPGNSAPTFRTIKEGTKNYSSLPALEAGVLIQPKQQFPGQARATTAGEAWRNYRNGPLTLLGGWLLFLAAVGVAGVYFLKGPIKLKSTPTGRLIERFTSVERMAHWSTAISFVLLALSGLILLFGKHILMPVFGHTLFGWLSFLCKNVHNFVGPVFTVSLIVTFIVFVKDNFPSKGDLQWMLSLGGMFGGKHVSSGRFNAGEKMWFWSGIVGLGLIISASGLVLNMLVPGMDYSRGVMQIANVVHLIAAVLVSTMAMGHIYIGSIGMEGAYSAMRTGYVDDAWAKEHHDLWYDDIEAGKVPRIRTQEKGATPSGAQPRSAT